ncbi:MAG: PPC domain-containing protein [Bacteroidota bacterium]
MMAQRILPILLSFLLVAPVAAQEYSGTLTTDAPTRGNGAHYNTHTFTAEANQEVTVRLEAPTDDFDTYLLVQAPNDETYENDDHGSCCDVSQVTFNAPQDGEYEIWVSAYSAEDGDEYGDYTVTVDRMRYEVVEEVSGRLDPEDEESIKGEYFDSLMMDVPDGPFIVELRALGFDGYLRVMSPDGESWRNDDYGSSESSYRLSRVEDLQGDGGEWQVDVTSYSEGETGAYDVRILTPADE